jgi:hypothetical protein
LISKRIPFSAISDKTTDIHSRIIWLVKTSVRNAIDPKSEAASAIWLYE